MSILDNLRWKKFPVLNDGHICLVDVMGDDSSIVQAARVSYGAGTKSVSDDRTLIRYLMRNNHLTPFEMCEVKVRVRLPMDVARQWWRHRTASINEYSTRYSEAIKSSLTTHFDEWRLQSTQNKQGSSDAFLDDNTGRSLSASSTIVLDECRELYQSAIDKGVAREVARRYLPLGTYTEAFWKCDLRNIFNFLKLRMDGRAQQEIREYATILGNEIIKPLFPIAYEAFVDYQLNSFSVSTLEQQMLSAAIKSLKNGFSVDSYEAFESITNLVEGASKRERRECYEKFLRLTKCLTR